jgi:hypothetical protein
METTSKTEQPQIVRTVQLSRIMHVVSPAEGDPTRRFQGVLNDGATRGKLEVFRCTQSIWEQIYGTRTEKSVDYGIRSKFDSQFLLRFANLNPEEKEAGGKPVLTVVGIDMIPSRSYVRGAAPVEYLENRKNGFEVEYREELGGFVVEKTYAGLDQRGLLDIIGAIRAHDGDRNSFTHNKHRIEKRDSVTWKVTPIKPDIYKA